MARIRSIHPGFLTDEEVMALTVDAPLCIALLIGLWGEADDHGLFEWKPHTIKARTLPSSTAPIGLLLDELITRKFIKKVSIAGREYGAVRNFMVYQRPRRPTFQHPVTDEVLQFVGSGRKKAPQEDDLSDSDPDTVGNEASSTLPPPDDGGKSLADGEKGREEERREERKNLSRRVANEAEAAFWAVYPPRRGDKGLAKANAILARLLARGVSLDEILHGVRCYRRNLEEDGKIGTEYVAMAQTWLNQRRWEDYTAKPKPNGNHPQSRRLEHALGDAMTDRLKGLGYLEFNEASKWLEWTDKGLASPDYQRLTGAP